MNANRGNDVRGVSKSSRDGGNIYRMLFGFGRWQPVTVMLNLCGERAFAITGVPFDSLWESGMSFSLAIVGVSEVEF